MNLPFQKFEGAGNDFVVTGLGLSGLELDWSAVARAVCCRRTAIGSDGLLAALPSSLADIRMRMFNPDGTEDDCGNGLRCIAWYAVREGLVEGRAFSIETIAGVRQVEITRSEGTRADVRIAMGRARLEPAAIPALFQTNQVLGEWIDVGGTPLQIYALSTGTAHTVVYHEPSELEFAGLSPRLEHHPLFPERTSIMWTTLEEPGRARVRIWERGAGETLACGTGACAVAVASLLSGRSGAEMEVVSRGGTLQVSVGPGLELTMTGPAAFVYAGAGI